jgi:hypothetical protein
MKKFRLVQHCTLTSEEIPVIEFTYIGRICILFVKEEEDVCFGGVLFETWLDYHYYY